MLAGSNEANTSDVLGLTAFNPDTLSGADQDAFYDFEELEEQHRTYLSRPFEVSTLTFLQDKALSADFTPDFVSIFDLLPVAHPATQHLAYRLQGLKSLSLQLESVECSHPELITQCSSLKNAIELDIQSLVLAVWMERSSRGSFAEGGLRVVKPESEYLIRPYTCYVTYTS
ncbi:hypothetical protein FS749_008553 [Ceratobasidium sp. UAMH 11750]|nr:hypothetical protein FS749_008553 [Ceratobasidium sp. UAMH 11750]